MRCEIQYTDLEHPSGEGPTLAYHMDPSHIPQIGTTITFEGVKGMFEVTDIEYKIMNNGDQFVRVLCGHYLGSHHRR